MEKLTFRDRIEAAWRMTPAVIKVKEISEASDMPDNESCDKNELYLGIIRGRHTDCLVLVKHEQTFYFYFGGRAENLSDEILRDCGIIPNRASMICRICHQFSTFLNTDNMCYDCSHQCSL